jgi:folylpolyglutamate synthase
VVEPRKDAAIHLGIPGQHQLKNASLALSVFRFLVQSKQLLYHLENQENMPKFMNLRENLPKNLTGKEILALKKTLWPGRCHTIIKLPVTYFLDGAHTPESMQVSPYYL